MGGVTQVKIIPMGHRRTSRECALQVLFEVDYASQEINEALRLYWLDHEEPEDIRQFTEELCRGTLRNLKEIDGVIESSSTNWKLSRMAAVDRNLLRVSAYELLYIKEIPPSVTINEAVEIAKKFGTEESPGFVNGLLDKIAKEKNRHVAH